MNVNVKPLWVASLLLCSLIVTAQQKFSKVKIVTGGDSAQRAHLVSMLQLDHFMEEEGALITEISTSDIKKLKLAAVPYQVLVDDVAANLTRLNRQYYEQEARRKFGQRVALEQPGSAIDAIIKKPAAFQVKNTFGGYYSFAEMEAAMTTLVTTYSSIASKTSIGKTSEGRDIWVIKISDNVATDETGEPEILYLGLQHAREAITGASMIFLMQYLCENYSTDTRIKNLIDNREFFIIPCFNPDGWEYNRTSMNGSAGGGWRKNRAPLGRFRGQDEYGVDLNRNWGVDWGNCSSPILGDPTACGSTDKSDETYSGSSAFSELETQAVRAFVLKQHIVAGFDQHAYGPYYSLPFGRKSLHPSGLSTKAQNFYTAVPALMGTYNGMRAADSYDALGYEVAGGFKDWMLMGEIGTTSGTGIKDTVWAMTGEGAAGGGSGGAYSSFWAPASQIENLSKSMCYQNLQLAYAAGTYVDVQDGNSMSVTSSTGNFSFVLKRLGIGNQPITVTLDPIENIQSAGAAATVTSMNYYDGYTGSVSYTLPSGIKNGERIRYAWKVATEGYTYADTVVKFFNPTVLFTDDMEGTFSDNWTATSNVTDTWAYVSGTSFSGSRSLTESPAGNYTSSSTRVVKYKGGTGSFDLSGATAAYLTFRTKYRAENFRDKLQVQVSVNNGTTWTAIPGTSTIQEPGTLDGSTLDGQPALTGIKDYWTQQLFNLDAFKGATALQLRFVFTSDSDPSSFKFEKDDGFYIDDVSVLKTTASLTVLPVTFLDFTGLLLGNHSVQLTWQAETSGKHHHFEMERSADGSSFSYLGRVDKLGAYRWLDNQPLNGDNFYRLRQVDSDGKYTYSKIIKIQVANAVQVAWYPNPVGQELTVSIQGAAPQAYRITLTDLQGKTVYTQTATNAATKEFRIATAGWVPQLYILKVTNGKGEVLTVQKLVKL